MKKTIKAALLVAITVCAADPFVSSAQASTVIPYPNRGFENSGTYSFTAINDGSVTAYFAGSAAGFSEVIGMLVNGIPTGIEGLNDHSSHIGDALVLGNVHVGDTIVFYDKEIERPEPDTWYSDPASNPVKDGQHVYSTLYDGLTDSILHVPAGVIPAGVYVGFEDLRRGLGSNFDYLDETFVVTNVATNVTPLPATLPLFATGLGGLVLLSWRRKRKTATGATC
jgi:hypothetical protein